MRKYLFLLIVLFLALFSCVDDNSSYEAQEKEKVDVEGVTPGGGEEEPPVDGELTPGVNLVKLNITEPDGQVVERRFKYFMPSTLVTSKPISLIFEFHGSYEFKKDELPIRWKDCQRRMLCVSLRPGRTVSCVSRRGRSLLRKTVVVP